MESGGAGAGREDHGVATLPARVCGGGGTVGQFWGAARGVEGGSSFGAVLAVGGIAFGGHVVVREFEFVGKEEDEDEAQGGWTAS